MVKVFESVSEFGDIEYRNAKGELHNINNKPAIVELDGSKAWCKNDQYHRDNGLPAVIWSDGREEYWINGERVK